MRVIFFGGWRGGVCSDNKNIISGVCSGPSFMERAFRLLPILVPRARMEI